MKTFKITAAAIALGLAGFAAAAQVVYVPPGAPAPRFGGEFALTQPGPVAGYWSTECRVWSIRAQENRDGPAAPPPLNDALTRFVSGVIQEHPNYGDMSPAMAEEVRHNLPTYWASLNRMGYASVTKKIGADDAGNALYVVDQKGGATHWNLTVDADGKIQKAFICEGQGV